ncbi:hypothetical protein [Pleionea sediminis]|uniref:hypothetical protein n=1 Tax=Pleionea sediminis TaxID=2569479 RepID=UPI001184DCFF|nr:hypothetical protein [Pleionea sediminis]
MYIHRYWAKQTSHSKSAIDALKNDINQLNEMPSVIYLVSAGELNVFFDEEVRQFVLWLESHNVPIEFVGAACTSIHAALLAFSESTFDSALVLSLECNRELQQECLNAVGVGNLPAQGGLTVKPCVGLMVLQKESDNSQWVVLDTQILSQALGIQSAQAMLRNLRHKISDAELTGNVVSFSICSSWSDSLLDGLESESWLPSYEIDHHHYLSLKPIFELQRLPEYETSDRTLLLMTLGGGGRVGLLLLGNATSCKTKTQFGSINRRTFDLQSELETIVEFKSTTRLVVDRLSNYMKYPSKDFRDISNLYFHWQKNYSWVNIFKLFESSNTKKLNKMIMELSE